MGISSCAVFEPVAPIDQFDGKGDANPVVVGNAPLWGSDQARISTSHSKAENGAFENSAEETGSQLVAETAESAFSYHSWGIA